MDKIVKFGESDLEIVPLIFGGNVFGWTLDEKQSFEILDQFMDLGFNAIDTANNYSHWVPGNKGGESETIIGNWLKERNNREKVVLMTKVAGRFGYDSKTNTKAEYIKEQVELSLNRLQTEYIDLYQTHYDDLDTPVEETLRAYEDLIKEGKVRYIGASNIKTDRLLESLDTSSRLGLPKYISLQPEYNLYDREKYETEYAETVQQYGLAVIPYYSLASGFLSGKYLTDDDFSKSKRGEGIEKRYWNERGQRIVAALNDVASAYRTSAASVALAWLIAQPNITAPIASATKESHLQGFVSALQLRLGEEALEKLNTASRY